MPKSLVKDIKACRGFTLSELMICVGIIGLLAAIAIPAFLQYFRSAKASEAPALVGKMVQLELVYFNTPRKGLKGNELNPCFLGIGTHPFHTPSSSKMNWAFVGDDIDPIEERLWNMLGFSTDSVYFNYTITSAVMLQPTRPTFEGVFAMGQAARPGLCNGANTGPMGPQDDDNGPPTLSSYPIYVIATGNLSDDTTIYSKIYRPLSVDPNNLHLPVAGSLISQ